MGAVRSMRQAAAAVMLGLMGLAASVAGWDEGAAAWRAGRYQDALNQYQPLAESGDAAAQNCLGLMFRDGQGTPRDFEQALRWCWRSSKHPLSR